MSTNVEKDINILDPKSFELFFEKTHHVALKFKDDGSVVSPLKVTLLFPLTDRDSYIQLIDEDELEVGIIRHLKELDKKSRDVILEEVNKTYFVPKIIEIKSIEEKFGADVWNVVTERGPRTFEVVGKRRNVRHLDSDQVIIKDIDGNRYEIRSLQELGASSRKLFDSEI